MIVIQVIADDHLGISMSQVHEPGRFCGKLVALLGAFAALGAFETTSFSSPMAVGVKGRALSASSSEAFWIDLGMGTVCRPKNMIGKKTFNELTPSQDEGQVVFDLSWSECKENCTRWTDAGNVQCYGVEYRVSQKRCELWKERLDFVDTFRDQTVPGDPDFHCMLSPLSTQSCCELVAAQNFLVASVNTLMEECHVWKMKGRHCSPQHSLSLLGSLHTLKTRLDSVSDILEPILSSC